MASFLMVLVFAPILLGATWLYTSPLQRLGQNTPAKVTIRIVLFAVMLGGLFAQLDFLAHNVPTNSRRYYLLSLLVVECVPMLAIMFYRYHRFYRKTDGRS